MVESSTTGSGDLSGTATCQDDKVIVSGGFNISDLQYRAAISAPDVDANAWDVTMARSGSGSDATLTVYALCADNGTP